MANLNQLIDVGIIKEKYNLKYFIETGTGMGETIDNILNYGFELIQSCEIEKTQFEELKNKYQQKNLLIHFGKSSDTLPKMLNNIDGPSLIFLDAHFPGQGYVRNEFISEKYTIDEIIPLENEFNILKTYKYISDSVIVVDDLRIYKKGNYSKGDWENGREMLQNPNYSFLEDLNDTHIKIESEIEQGCVIFYPINNKVC
jgi:hypothetical protein